jgi:hypothetical protein
MLVILLVCEDLPHPNGIPARRLPKLVVNPRISVFFVPVVCSLRIVHHV